MTFFHPFPLQFSSIEPPARERASERASARACQPASRLQNYRTNSCSLGLRRRGPECHCGRLAASPAGWLARAYVSCANRRLRPLSGRQSALRSAQQVATAAAAAATATGSSGGSDRQRCLRAGRGFGRATLEAAPLACAVRRARAERSGHASARATAPPAAPEGASERERARERKGEEMA